MTSTKLRIIVIFKACAIARNGCITFNGHVTSSPIVHSSVGLKAAAKSFVGLVSAGFSLAAQIVILIALILMICKYQLSKKVPTARLLHPPFTARLGPRLDSIYAISMSTLLFPPP